MAKLSVVVPVLNEAVQIESFLKSLTQSDFSSQLQIIIVDGGSADQTINIVESKFPQLTLISSPAGRAQQMNSGAELAEAPFLLFLHGDTQLPQDFLSLIEAAFVDVEKHWGRFNVRLSSDKCWAKIISSMINWRSKRFGIATGDQAIFVRKEAFNAVGGFPEQLLMEDVELSKRLIQKFSAPVCLQQSVVTSSRRWEKHGVLKTVLLMWRLRFYYFIGISADKLHRMYYS